MRELNIYSPDDLKVGQRSGLTLFLCDESLITCRTLRRLQEKIATLGQGVVLAMPDDQYKKGTRGWAKVQILASVADNLTAVMSLDYDAAQNELRENWSEVVVNGLVVWKRSDEISGQNKDFQEELEIIETSDRFDREMISLANREVASSNCWLDPAGCVFVKDKQVLVKSTSQSLNDSRCIEIPFDFKDLALDRGERMIFCDSQHSERVAISQAAKEGISLNGATMYVTKFPCRPCVQSAITAGVTTIVFENGSYGLLETADIIKNNSIVLKKVVASQPWE